MKIKILLTSILLYTTAFYVNAQTFTWAKNPGSNSLDHFNVKIVADASGNSYTTSKLGTAGGLHLLCNGLTGNVLLKYDPIGACAWEVSLEGIATDIAYDGGIYIYVCGYIGTPGVIGDMFVAKYDVNGNKIGNSYFATSTYSNPSSIQAYSISVTSFGVFVSGSVYKNAVLYTAPNYGGATITVLLNATRYGIIVLKLNTGLTYQWHSIPAGTGDAESLAICNSPATGYSYITGYFNNTAFSGGVQLTSVGGRDAFVAKLTPDGLTWLWTRGGGSTNVLSFDRGTDIIVSPVNTGLIFVSGIFTSAGTLGTFNLSGGWFAKFLTPNNGVTAVNTGFTEAYSVTVDNAGMAYVGGNNFIRQYTNGLAFQWGLPLANSPTCATGLAANGCDIHFSGSLYFATGVCTQSIGSIPLSNSAIGCGTDRDLLIGKIGCAAPREMNHLDSTVGYQDKLIEANIQIVPNPNNGKFQIIGIETGDVATIINMAGQTIYQQAVGQSSLLNVEMLKAPKGIYLLHIQGTSKHLTKKFIVE